MEQSKQSLNLVATVSGLEVADNSGDDRFPFIIKNKPIEGGQQDLVSFKLKNVSKISPKFKDCETMIKLGFSGLEVYWKPQSILNLLEFINTNKPSMGRSSSQDAQ